MALQAEHLVTRDRRPQERLLWDVGRGGLSNTHNLWQLLGT